MPDGVLFVHNNFPAQFRMLATRLREHGVSCCAIGQDHAPGLDIVRTARYRLPRGTTPGILEAAVRPEADLIRAAGALKAARYLKEEEGWQPEVIVAHPGWGETLHLHRVFPDARQVHFAEFFYHARGFDLGFDPEFNPPTEDSEIKAEAKNMGMALAYARADVIVSPTEFQASSLPAIFRDRARVIHEGVDIETIAPAPASPFELPDGRVLAPGTPVITHVNNQMEPLRGLHIFARALPRLMAEVPDAHVIVIGQEKKSGYGGIAPDDKTWKQVCFEPVEDRLDLSRLHFLGKVAHDRMHAAMRLSSAHVYYTYPFVLSWSLAEALALGCYVIGSDTAPMHDAIEDGVNGRLLPFFDIEALSEAMIEACRHPERFAAMRAAARKTAVAKFDQAKGLTAWLELLKAQGLRIPR